MGPDIRKHGRRVLLLFPDLLSRIGIVDRKKGRETFELAVPAMVTGGIWILLRLTDFFMVSVAVSDAAVAALTISFQYYFVAFAIAMSVAGGTISLVSRFKGARRDDEANFVVKQALWFAIVLSIPMSLIAWLYAEFFIALLTPDAEVIRLGAIYLQIVMVVFVFRFWSFIAARGLEGCGDTRTPMYVNLIVIPLNIVLNAILIFGLGPIPFFGLAGAAIGTAIANTLSGLIFASIYLSGRFPIRLQIGGRQWDMGVVYEIIRIGTPLGGMRLIGTLGGFPFLFILGTLGTPVVAAYGIGQRVMNLATIPGFGYATSASALVGQSLGRGEESEATEYGWQTLRIALATELAIAAFFFVFATPVARLFGTAHVDLTATFIRVFALTVVGAAIAASLRGGLRAAGDTTWPFYAAVAGAGLRVGISLLALPATFIILTFYGIDFTPGLGLGVIAVFVAIVIDRYARATIIATRYASGKWKIIAQRSTETAAQRGD